MARTTQGDTKTNTEATRLERIDALDADIVSIARSIRVLDSLTWPRALEATFLDGWHAGNPQLPVVEATPVDHHTEIEALESIMSRCDRADPLGDHLYKTAWSYSTAARMLGAIGTPEFTRHSVRLYGRPDRVYPRQRISSFEAAGEVLAVTAPLQHSSAVRQVTPDIPAADFAARLRPRIAAFFSEDPVDVVVDAAMSARAAAGAKQVKVQAGATFSDLDLAQLLNHEAFIHAATSLSGQHQPHLRVLGLGSPRTTKTQEGLAVFSELVTYSMDLIRLRRLALRSVAIDAALASADFIDVYRIFLAGGETETDAYDSAQRVFRGGDVRGRVAFTKDAVYLEGLLLVQTFLRKLIADDRPELIPVLFSGRLTLGDVIELQPAFDDGFLLPARYLPTWARGLSQLSTYLAYSLVSGHIRMEEVELQRFLALEDATETD